MPGIQIRDRLKRYTQGSFLADSDGFIAWKRGTGDNVELADIESLYPGGGTRLFVRMLVALQKDPPYETVYGFTRISNQIAIAFYHKMGMVLQRVQGIYADGEAVLFTARYEFLCHKHGVWGKVKSRKP